MPISSATGADRDHRLRSARSRSHRHDGDSRRPVHQPTSAQPANADNGHFRQPVVLPDAGIVEIDDAYTFVPADQPEAVAREMKFLSSPTSTQH